MSTDPREFEHPIDGTGGSVTPIVDVIAGVLRTHDSDFTQDDWWICCSCGTDWLIENCSFSDAKAEFAAHQARAVLAALEQAGSVEVVTGYGVKLKSGDVERTGTNILDAKEWLEDMTGGDDPDYEPVEVVTRTTATITVLTDWTAVTP